MSWRLPEEAFEFLAPKLRALGNVPVVELGSGPGTMRLAVLCRGRLWSVEHDETWLEKYPVTTYIHAPIVDGWYDRTALEAALPKSIGALIVDGPPQKIGRKGLLANLDLFGDVPMFIDDTHREDEFNMATEIALRRGVEVDAHMFGNRGFTALGWA